MPFSARFLSLSQVFCLLTLVITYQSLWFSYAVFAARAPAMGNSADRAWQLSQLVEGVLTAFNPSHGSLSCFDEVVARAVRVSQPAVLSALLAIQLFGIVISPPYFPQRAPKGALRPFLGRSAPSLRFMVRFGIFCCRQDFLSRFT